MDSASQNSFYEYLDKGTFRFIDDVTNKYNEHQLIRITRKPYNGKSEF